MAPTRTSRVTRCVRSTESHLRRDPASERGAENGHIVEPETREKIEIGAGEIGDVVQAIRSRGLLPARMGGREHVMVDRKVTDDRSDALRSGASMKDKERVSLTDLAHGHGNFGARMHDPRGCGLAHRPAVSVAELLGVIRLGDLDTEASKRL